MKCSLCGKESENLEKCSYCKKKTCKDCMTLAEVGRVCKKCDRETARQLQYEGWEINLEEE